MTRGRKKKSGFRAQIVIALVAVLTASYAMLAWAEKITPEEGLLRITQKTTVNKDFASELRLPLAAIQKMDLTDLWGKIVLARKLDEAGEKKLAVEALETVSAKIEKGNTAASFEAILLLNRLRLELGQKLSSFEPLEKQLTLYRRKDLEAESLYANGLYYLQTNEIEEARKTLISLRERYPTSEFAKSARVLKELTVSKPDLREVELLIREGDINKAESELNSYQQQYPRNSSQYYESLLTKDTLLRKEKKGIEADELLLSIAADGPESAASNALFRAAKNAWNENNSLRALELLDQLFDRFPKSALIPDAHYTEARILEELGKLRNAEKIYEQPISQLEKVAADNKEVLRLVKSIKRAVWLKFARGDYENSVALSDKTLPVLIALSTDLELRSEALGLKYWTARSYSQMKTEKGDQKAKELFASIFESDRRTFYGALSQEHLVHDSQARASFFRQPSEPCNLLDVGDLRAKLGIFGNQKLKKFAQHEIDFTFGNLNANSTNLDLPTFLASQAKLSSVGGEVSSQIQLAEEGLKIGKKDSTQFACEAELAALAYPSPYLEFYQKAQAANQISLPLSLAISRSESYFDPEARSVVGALGLMQLMPETAKLEGWNGKSELTDPEVNVSLGVKHLKRLMNSFGSDVFKVAASYNAGSSAVNRWTDRYGVFPSDLYVEFIGYPETNKYVRRVYAAKKVYEEILGGQQK